MYDAQPYHPGLRQEWNAFVSESRNGTFLFQREYMDYHADRYQDASLVFVDTSGQIIALLPSCRSGESVTSHGGLTYGGLVLGAGAGTRVVCEILDRALDHYRGEGAKNFVYKCVPHMYHRMPAEEDLYALFRAGATLVRRDVSSTVQPSCRPPAQERRKRGVRKAERAGVEIHESDDFASFWPTLERNLNKRHAARPVHSLQEMQLLAGRFRTEIKLFLASIGGAVLAGTIVYETPRVAHAQYIASSDEGRQEGALDLLFERLIGDIYRDKPYFDFGISTEEGGMLLNEGLIEYKEGFGATATVYSFYRIDL